MESRWLSIPVLAAWVKAPRPFCGYLRLFLFFRLVAEARDGLAVLVVLRERDEQRLRAAVRTARGVFVDVAARGLAVGVLGDLEHVLAARIADRNDHDAARLELLQQRRRNVVDAGRDDDLVERAVLFPAVIAVGRLALDRGEFAEAALGQLGLQFVGELGERRDDLDSIDLVGEVREDRRLVARARADLEHLLARLQV